MSKVWVVLGESGEYSDRNVWVSGVYSSEESARQAVELGSECRRVFDDFNTRYYAEYRRLMALPIWGEDRLYSNQSSPYYKGKTYRIMTDLGKKQLDATMGSPPPIEDGERFEVQVVDLDTWTEQS